MSKDTDLPAKHPAVSPITRRILAINLLALAIPVAGLLYLGQYRQGLIDAELAALKVQGRIFAAAIAENAGPAETTGPEASGRRLLDNSVNILVRRLVAATDTRARLFDAGGVMVADSRSLMSSSGPVQVEPLPPPGERGVLGAILEAYDQIIVWLPDRKNLSLYREKPLQRATDYPEVLGAISGETGEAVRAITDDDEDIVLSVAVPVQRYKQVLGALMLSKDGRDIETALFEVRLNILKIFFIAFAVTVLLSFYLAGTIARPLHRLAASADRIRQSHNRRETIPDFSGRGDEIEDLAAALRDMTDALWLRMDAIERFAADVAHEIKNPLTSLRSAVETAALVKEPDRQKRLMEIILEDVGRLDRLISDISEASRLDAELSRARMEPTNLGMALSTLVDIYRSARGQDAKAKIRLKTKGDLIVNGLEGRLGQVFRNLLDNALSFSPPGGVIEIFAFRENGFVEVTVDDDGPGFQDGKEAAVFERFYTERPEAEKFGLHSGLGLSICKMIVDTHGGSITVETRKDETGRALGGRVTVRLPVE